MKLLSPICLLLGIEAAQAAPNVLFIAVDDLRPELNCYGATHMITPNMDKLAASGRLFRNHYVAVPTCGASRYALMSGLRPTTETDDNDAFNYMPSSPGADPESWVELLRRNGWHTASIGKITHEPDGYRWSYPSSYDIGRSKATNPDMRFSFNEIIWGHDKWGAQRYPLFAYADGTGRVKNVSPAWENGTNASGETVADDAYPDGQMAVAAIDKLREFAEEGTRFCLALGFQKPHLPFNAPKAYYDLYSQSALPDPAPANAPTNNNYTGSSGEVNSYTANSDVDQLRHAYFACVSYVDAQIGKVLDELDALNLSSNTVVVLWGDHGWCLGDYGGQIGKHRVLERAVESPLIIRAPDHTPECFAGIATMGVVETIDIYPTIAELCGLTPPSGPVGSSLVPMLQNPFAPGKEHAYSRFGSASSVRTPEWRLINNSGTIDLYDLSSYRYEVNDVAGANPDVVSDLTSALSIQAVRPGTNYTGWAGVHPQLADPAGDADNDGYANFLEYAFGADALERSQYPNIALERSGDQMVYSFTVNNLADDLSWDVQTSTNLLRSIWGYAPLQYADSTTITGGLSRLRYHVPNDVSPSLFFRLSVQLCE